MEAELEQLLERVGVVVARPRRRDRGDQVGEPRAALLVLHHREHGLRLPERDLGRLALERRRYSCSSSESSACSSCSKPPVSIAQWMPHSFGAFVSHHQRPARDCSPGATARVHGAQPIEV